METFENTILRWMCLFDEFNNIGYSNAKHLISSTSFKQFVDDVFSWKCSSALGTDDTKLYNTIKVNYVEFEVQNYEDLYNEDNAIYTCVIVLLHALLKCTNDQYRNQLNERMDNEEQILLVNFLKAIQPSLFTKQNISEALLLLNGSKQTCNNVSEMYSNNDTSIKSKSMRRSYLQELCQSPKYQSFINQEKEKLIAKLTEDYKNEYEENYKLAENVKCLQDRNTKLSNKLEDNDLIIKKLNREKIDLEKNCNELMQQVTELEKKHKGLYGKFEMKTLDYNNLILMFENIENENMLLKSNLKLFEETIQKKNTEIISLKDELCNKSITYNPTNMTTCKENNAMTSNSLFNELNNIKLEEMIHDKEKYKYKYKSKKKDLSNAEIHVKELNEKIITLEKKLDDHETRKDKLIDQFSNKIKELEECKKENNNLQSIIDEYKNSKILSQQNFIDLEKKLNMINNEKSTLELQLNETITKLTNENQDLSLKLEINETTNALKIQEKLILEQKELKKQIEKSNEQIKTLSFLNADKDKLQEETDKLQKCLNINECSLKSMEDKVLICVKLYAELQTFKTNLILDEGQLKLSNLNQESKKQQDIDIKYIELQGKFKKKQTELVDYISIYNCHITDLISDNLINKIDALQSSLLNKDNVIAANQEKLFVYEEMNDEISFKIPGKIPTINHTNNVFNMNKAYIELFAVSKTQLKTIQRLQTEMFTLKSQCAYKMTKLQQETRESVTSEYEIKFERKREQIKQFCKDLEAINHQDFETKLLKHKEKIFEGETMSIPFEMSIISETTIANCSNYDTENLIPNDPTKEKNRNQPGPPIPIKNEGCVSLLSNPKITLKASKRANTDKTLASSTPKKCFR